MTDHVERAVQAADSAVDWREMHERYGPASTWPPSVRHELIHALLRGSNLLAAPVDGGLREQLTAVLFDRTWSSIREDALPPEDQVWEAVRDDVDALMPAITAHVHDEARAAQQRLLSWLAQHGQGLIKGGLLLDAEQAIEVGDV